jgi:hypothetical protein
MEQRAIDPSWSTVQALSAALGVSCEAFQDTDGGAKGAASSPGKDKPAGTKKKGKGK